MRAAERAALTVVAAVFAVVGTVMFFAPDWASTRFAWRVSPFVTMTIGAWCLGNAWCAIVALRHVPALAFASVLYLLLFSLFEAAVLVAFRDRVVLTTPLAWGYVLAIAVTVVVAAALVAAWLRRPGAVSQAGRAMSRGAVIANIVFVAAVGLLAAYVLTRGPVETPTVFPEPLSLFTLRSFGAFYAAIALASTSLLVTRGLGNALAYGFANCGLVTIILAAALAFFGVFDVGAHPLQWVYIGAYVAVGVFLALYFVRYGTGRAVAARG